MSSDPDFDREIFDEIEGLVAPLAQSYAGKGDLGEKFREALRGIELRDRPRTSQAIEAIRKEGRRISPKHVPALDVAKWLLTYTPDDDQEPFDYAGYLAELKASRAHCEEGKVWTKENRQVFIWPFLGTLLIPVGVVLDEPRLIVGGVICSLFFLWILYLGISMRQMNRETLKTTDWEIARVQDMLDTRDES